MENKQTITENKNLSYFEKLKLKKKKGINRFSNKLNKWVV